MKPSTQQGFTLIEVLVAITLFAIGILAVASMQGTTSFTNAAANAITEATTVNSQQVEFLMDRPYTHPDLQQVAGGKTLNLGKYQASWTVQDNFPIQGTKTLTMTVVGGAESGQIRKTVTLQKIIAQGQNQ